MMKGLLGTGSPPWVTEMVRVPYGAPNVPCRKTQTQRRGERKRERERKRENENENEKNERNPQAW